MINPSHRLLGIFTQMFKYLFIQLFVVPSGSSASNPPNATQQSSQATPSRPQRSRQPVINPGMVSPPPDGRRRVSVNHAAQLKTVDKTKSTDAPVIISSPDREESEKESSSDTPEVVQVQPSSNSANNLKKKLKKKKKKKADSDKPVSPL